MTVEQTEYIDSIGIDDKRVNLLIIDDLKWDIDDDNHLFLLQEKINAYLRFFESGEMHKKYPKSHGLNVEFEIFFKYSPNEKCQWFLDHLKPILTNIGVRLIIKGHT